MTDSATPAPEDTRIDLTLAGVVLLTTMYLLAMAAQMVMPFNINGIIISFGVSNAAAGLTATIEIAGMALGSMIFAQVATRVRARRIYVPALGVVLAANMGAVWAPTIDALYACRGMGGFAAGAIVATVMATAGCSTKPEFTFAVLGSGSGTMTMLIALLLPQALKFHELALFPDSMSAADGLYGVYAVFGVLALLFVWSVPVAPLSHDARKAKTTPDSAPPKSGWVALCGLSILYFCFGALFIVNIATEQVHISAEAVGMVLVFGSALVIFVPFVASWLSTLFPSVFLIGAMVLMLGIGGVMLGNAQSSLTLYLVAPVLITLPAGIFAPLLGGAISSTGDYSALGWLLGGCAMIAAPLLFGALREADRRRGAVQTSVKDPVIDSVKLSVD
jgi:MFS family permease